MVELLAGDARNFLAQFGTIEGTMSERDDGGWNAIVTLRDGSEVLASVVKDTAGEIHYAFC